MTFLQRSKSFITVFSIALLFALAATAVAAEPTAAVNASQGLTLAGPGLAIHGYDAVAFFTDKKPTLGSAKFSWVHQGATYRFASASNLKAFEKNPARYAPQFGGFCTFGVSVGAKFDGDPKLWRVVDGKLYFNLNEDIRDTWSKDVPGNIAKAEKQWRKIQDATPASLK